MPTPISLLLALRYNSANKENQVISFVSLFAIIAIGLGVLALIVVTAVMNGFEAQLKKRILSVVPQILVQDKSHYFEQQWLSTSQQLQQIPQIQNVLPYSVQTGMLQSPTGLKGVQVQGIFQSALAISQQQMQMSELSALAGTKFSVVISEQLASSLRVGYNDKLRLTLAQANPYSPLGSQPIQRLVTIVGIYDTGTATDLMTVFMSGEGLNLLLKRPRQQVDTLRLFIQEPFDAPQKKGQLQQQYPQWQWQDWQLSQGKLFAAVKIEKKMMTILLASLILIATFNIVNAQIMLVKEKQAEIAILKTQGMQNQQIATIFIWQGVIQAVIGSSIGMVLGVLLTVNINHLLSFLSLQFVPLGFGGLPVLLLWSQVLLITFSAILLTVSATLYPAYKSTKVLPAQILRYE